MQNNRVSIFFCNQLFHLRIIVHAELMNQKSQRVLKLEQNETKQSRTDISALGKRLDGRKQRSTTVKRLVIGEL